MRPLKLKTLLETKISQFSKFSLGHEKFESFCMQHVVYVILRDVKLQHNNFGAVLGCQLLSNVKS